MCFKPQKHLSSLSNGRRKIFHTEKRKSRFQGGRGVEKLFPKHPGVSPNTVHCPWMDKTKKIPLIKIFDFLKTLFLKIHSHTTFVTGHSNKAKLKNQKSYLWVIFWFYHFGSLVLCLGMSLEASRIIFYHPMTLKNAFFSFRYRKTCGDRSVGKMVHFNVGNTLEHLFSYQTMG